MGADCRIVSNVRRKSSRPCARADDALPTIQTSARDPRHVGIVVIPNRAAAPILQAALRFSIQLSLRHLNHARLAMLRRAAQNVFMSGPRGAEFPPLRTRGFGPFSMTVLPIPRARRAAPF